MPWLAAAHSSGILDELQTALSDGTLDRRVALLRGVTALFVGGASEFSAEQIELFDEVFTHLVRHMHVEARAMLAEQLAPLSAAPRNTIRDLARDDMISVAAPVLSQSECLDDDFLVEAASSQSPAHLRAISSRTTLSTSVTDVLVERGDSDAVRAVVRNPRAQLSDRGYGTLERRPDLDNWISDCIAMRPAMPRHQFLRLTARASRQVLDQLLATYPDAEASVHRVVHEALDRVRRSPAAIDPQTLDARDLVQSLHTDGRLDDRQVCLFADEDRFDALAAALANLASTSLLLTEALLADAQDEGLFVLGKVCGLGWDALACIIAMRTRMGHPPVTDLAASRQAYERLRANTAHQALRFYRIQIVSGPVPLD
jgi:uncharacterized protein (DUF2336 family)